MTSTSVFALCADRNIEVGLHVTLFSLMQNLSGPAKIYLVQKGYRSQDIDKIHKTLLPFMGAYELVVLEFDDSIFKRYRGIHGNRFTFTRIVLAELLSQEDRVLYLDSDLVVACDLAPLFEQHLGGHAIGVSGMGTMEWALEKNFFASLGLNSTAHYFNAGVLLIDLAEWRILDMTNKCFEFADQHASSLLAADQTILNVMFYKNRFAEVDEKYNVALYPNSRRIDRGAANGVYHFVGSPKPWDFFGEFVHTNYRLFGGVLRQTAFRGYRTYLDITWARLKRFVVLSKAYIHCLSNRPN